MQALFLFGALGEVWLMATQDQAAVNFVAEHPWATLLVGPSFAAITGVAIKEGLCYGKFEAASLALVCSCLQCSGVAECLANDCNTHQLIDNMSKTPLPSMLIVCPASYFSLVVRMAAADTVQCPWSWPVI